MAIILKKLSQSKVYVNFINSLSDKDYQQLEAIISRHIRQQVNSEIEETKVKAGKILTELLKAEKSQGFYDALNTGEIMKMNSTEYLNGVEEALEYLKTRPDQIIQHYADPDPKPREYRHYKDRG